MTGFRLITTRDRGVFRAGGGRTECERGKHEVGLQSYELRKSRCCELPVIVLLNSYEPHKEFHFTRQSMKRRSRGSLVAFRVGDLVGCLTQFYFFQTSREER